MNAVLPAGMAKGHRANPASTINALKTYGTPVLLSGVSTLTLSKSETKLVDQNLKFYLQNLQKLYDKTPPCVTYFLAGHLPGEAVLHLKQLSTFGMVSRLQDSVVHQMATHILTSSKLSPASSWFMQIRELCLMYFLPTPITLLTSPPTKTAYKKLVSSKVIDYWEKRLRAEAAGLLSLAYFKPEYMSLSSPHPLWQTCGSNPFEVNKAVTQARMLSGRYRTDLLACHWTTNRSGVCLLPLCTGSYLGSIEHLLLYCPALQETRNKMMKLMYDVASESPYLYHIISWVLSHPDRKSVMTQFLLDCSSLPIVVNMCQLYGSEMKQRLFYITRNWCYSIHRSRMTQMKLPQYR